MSDASKVHVVPHENGWAVKTEGASRAANVYNTQAEAIQRGREIAQGREGQLFIHRENGQIREERTYRQDPPQTPG